MSFQGYQPKVNPQEGHEIPGAEKGAQMMQLTQIQLAQIVSSTMSQALTQHAQQAVNNPPLAAAASNVVVQQVQSLIKFDVSVFEGDSAASWLTWSKRIVYQAKGCGFETELKAAEGKGLGVGADVFDRSNVDPVRLRNAHVAWMTRINNAEKWHLKLCNVAKHRMTLGEASNHTTEQRELENVDPVRLRNAHVAWMTRINNAEE